MLAACGNMNDFPTLDPLSNDGSENDGGDGTTEIINDPGTIDNNLVGNLSTSDIPSLAFAVNEAAYATKPEQIPTSLTEPMYEDYVENMYDEEDEEYSVSVEFLENGIKIDDKLMNNGTYYKLVHKKDTFEINGAHLTVHANKKYQYELSGSSSNGSLTLYQNKKCSITLNGLKLHNTKGAAINLQSGKRAYINIVGDDNVLSDCSAADYTEKYDPHDGFKEDEKGVIFSEGKLSFAGNGKLTINANGKNGIASDDYVFLRPGPRITIHGAPDADGVKAKDGIYLFGSVLNVFVKGNAAKGLNCDNVIDMRDGRVTVFNDSQSVSDGGDIAYSAGVKTDTEMRVTGGELYVTASKLGGKGIRAKQSLFQGGGKVQVITAVNEAVNAEEMTINGGRLLARADGSQGIVSGGTITVNGGVVEALASDDAIVADKYMQNDGYVYACSNGSNGLIAGASAEIKDGLLYAIGKEKGIETYDNKVNVTGGAIAAVGANMPTLLTDASVSYSTTLSVVKGSLLCLCDASTQQGHIAMQMPFDAVGSPAHIVLSAKTMEKGATYNILSGGSLSLNDKGVALQGLYANGIIYAPAK